MSKAFEEIARDATRLSREQQFSLARLLLELNEESADAGVSAVWKQEVLARIRAVDEDEEEQVRH